MCCPPSETAAAMPSSWTAPSPDVTSFMEIQRWTLHTVTKLRATQLAGRDRVIKQSSIAIDNFMENNYTPGHKNCFTAAISNLKYTRASLNKFALLNSANEQLLMAHHKNTSSPLTCKWKSVVCMVCFKIRLHWLNDVLNLSAKYKKLLGAGRRWNRRLLIRLQGKKKARVVLLRHNSPECTHSTALRHYSSASICLYKPCHRALPAASHSSSQLWFSFSKWSMHCILMTGQTMCQSMRELGFEDNAGHSGGERGANQALCVQEDGSVGQNSRRSWANPKCEYLWECWHSTPYTKELPGAAVWPSVRRWDDDHPFISTSLLLLPGIGLSSSAQQNDISFTFPTSLKLPPVSKA